MCDARLLTPAPTISRLATCNHHRANHQRISEFISESANKRKEKNTVLKPAGAHLPDSPGLGFTAAAPPVPLAAHLQAMRRPHQAARMITRWRKVIVAFRVRGRCIAAKMEAGALPMAGTWNTRDDARSPQARRRNSVGGPTHRARSPQGGSQSVRRSILGSRGLKVEDDERQAWPPPWALGSSRNLASRPKEPLLLPSAPAAA
jgi:hypothetical protein